MKMLDRFLNSITMYRLLLYGLAVLALTALVLSVLGILAFAPLDLVLEAVLLMAICNLAEWVLAKIVKVEANVESASITALILFFIFLPGSNLVAIETFLLAGIIAILSKYVLGVKRRQVFNPAAIAAVLMSLLGFYSAFWWIGSLVMLPFVVVFGFLILRKIRRFALFFTFVIGAIFTGLGFAFLKEQNLLEVLTLTITSGPLIFLGTVMLTEPLSTPPTKKLQIIYGLLVGILFSMQFNVGALYSSPELALVLGNIFSFVVSFKQKLFLTLKGKSEIGANLFEFSFLPKQKLNFLPGQYLEWTLRRSKLKWFQYDQRGVRRYFTIASSPTESEVKLAVKVVDNGSSFKRDLLQMQTGDQLYVSGLSGEFVLPEDVSKKLVFVAGGIGVTPFRSMIKYLIDLKQKRDIVFFYLCNCDLDFVYTDLFKQAERELGVKMVYVVSKPENCSTKWLGKTGYLSKEMILEEVQDFAERKFYLSGPDAMVQNYKKMLLTVPVASGEIKTDYFPGF